MVTIAVTTIITVTVIFKTVHSKLAKKESPYTIHWLSSPLPVRAQISNERKKQGRQKTPEKWPQRIGGQACAFTSGPLQTF